MVFNFFVRGGAHLPDPDFLAPEIIVVVTLHIKIDFSLLICVYFLRRIRFQAVFGRDNHYWLLNHCLAFVILSRHSFLLRFYCVRPFQLFERLVQIVLLFLYCL